MKKIALLSVLVFISIGLFSQNNKGQVYTVDGKAIKGYDPVAYFTKGKPIKGTEKYAYSWQGAKWLFSSKTHLDLFKATPEKYAPEYGGYCSWAMREGKKAKTNPVTSWTVHKGKLYLNYSTSIASKWSKNKDGYIKLANGYWGKKYSD